MFLRLAHIFLRNLNRKIKTLVAIKCKDVSAIKQRRKLLFPLAALLKIEARVKKVPTRKMNNARRRGLEGHVAPPRVVTPTQKWRPLMTGKVVYERGRKRDGLLQERLPGLGTSKPCKIIALPSGRFRQRCQLEVVRVIMSPGRRSRDLRCSAASTRPGRLEHTISPLLTQQLRTATRQGRASLCFKAVVARLGERSRANSWGPERRQDTCVQDLQHLAARIHLSRI